MKELSLTELRAEKQALQDECRAIIAKAKSENRAMTTEEWDKVNANNTRAQEINTEMAGRDYSIRQQAPRREAFSLRRAVVAMLEHREQRDSEAAVLEEGARLSRGLMTGAGGIYIPLETRAAVSAAASSGVVDTEAQEMLLPLRPNLVLAQAGAKFFTGLVGDVAFPSYSGTTVNWEGETDEAADGGGAITSKVFKPKRLAAYVDISKQLLLQENQDIESKLREDIAIAIAQKLEATALGGATTAAGVPDGLFTGYTGTPAAIDWAGIVKMETDLEDANGLSGSLAYIMHPALVGAAKTTVKDASGAGGFVFGSDGAATMNGYNVLRSGNVAKGLGTGTTGYGVVFGNWADYFVGQWGAVELLVDPYTQATKGTVRLVVNSYWDLGKIRDASFVRQAFALAE